MLLLDPHLFRLWVSILLVLPLLELPSQVELPSWEEQP